MWNDGLTDPFVDEAWAVEEQMREMKYLGICFGGGKGGGGSAPAPQPQTVTQNTSSLPDYVEPFFTSLLERGEEESLKEYTPFTGQRIADIGDTEQRAFGLVAGTDTDPGIVGRFDPSIQAAVGTAATGQGYLPQQIRDITAAGQIADSNQFLSQYMDAAGGALDVAEQRAQRRFDEQQLERDAAAVGAGAFGQTRADLVNRAAQRDLNEQLLAQEAQILADAQTRALDMGRQTAQMGVERDLSAAGLGGEFARTGLAAATTGQEMGLTDANALQQIGAIERDLQQQRLDLDYADFISERDFPRQQINYMGALLHGVPVTPQSEVVQFQARNPTAELLGLGLGAAGLSRLFS